MATYIEISNNVRIELEGSIRDLKNDLKDDWFPDPILFQDCLRADVVREYIETNVAANAGTYKPTKCETFNLPKNNFLIRYSLESNIYDRLVYLALARKLIAHFDSYLSPNVFSHRLNTDAKTRKKYIFKNGIEQWKSYEGIVRANIKADSIVLITDIFSYFENISIKQLEGILIRRIPALNLAPKDSEEIEDTVNLLTTYLSYWSFNGHIGLPQNRDASSFLANILMDEIDKEIINRGLKYYRYMDDIRVVCSSESEAKKSLKIISEKLRQIGLNLNSGKTKIGPFTRPDIRGSFATSDRQMEAIDNMWKSRSIEIIKKSLPYLMDYTLKLIDKNETSSRGFRFSIRRIRTALSSQQIEIDASFLDSVTSSVIKELYSSPTATDEFTNFLSHAPLSEHHISQLIDFLVDDNKSIYSWQKYRVWLLVILKDLRHETLTAKALSIIHNPADHRGPEIAGIQLYLGKFGCSEDKRKIIDHFKTINSPWLQRISLISLHEVSYRDGINDIAHLSLDSVKGTYGRLSKSPLKGTYVLPFPESNYKTMIDESSEYDFQ